MNRSGCGWRKFSSNTVDIIVPSLRRGRVGTRPRFFASVDRAGCRRIASPAAPDEQRQTSAGKQGQPRSASSSTGPAMFRPGLPKADPSETDRVESLCSFQLNCRARLSPFSPSWHMRNAGSAKRSALPTACDSPLPIPCTRMVQAAGSERVRLTCVCRQAGGCRHVPSLNGAALSACSAR